MGSSLAVVIRKGDRILVTYDGRGDTLQGRLAFGPEAAWRSFVNLGDKRYWIEAVSGQVKPNEDYFGDNVPSFKNAIENRGYGGFAYIDYDEKVLWYKTGCDMQWDCKWSAWLASWISCFWPEWRVFRNHQKFGGVKSFLQLLDLAPLETTPDKSDEDYIARSIKGTFKPPAFPTRNWPFLVRQNGKLFLCRLYLAYALDVLLRGSTRLIAEALPHATELKPGQDDELDLPIELMVDLDTKTIWSDDHHEWMDLCTTRYWPGWTFFAEPQGLFIWLHNLGHVAFMPDITRRWVHDATKWFKQLSIEELILAANDIGIINAASDPILLGRSPEILSQLKLDVPKDRTNSYKEYVSEANKEVRDARRYFHGTNETAQVAFRQFLLLRMTDIYISQRNFDAKVWIDRSHPYINPRSTCPFTWTPNIAHLLWGGESIDGEPS